MCKRLFVSSPVLYANDFLLKVSGWRRGKESGDGLIGLEVPEKRQKPYLLTGSSGVNNARSHLNVNILADAWKILVVLAKLYPPTRVLVVRSTKQLKPFFK
jgi:hypothetical protein